MPPKQPSESRRTPNRQVKVHSATSPTTRWTAWSYNGRRDDSESKRWPRRQNFSLFTTFPSLFVLLRILVICIRKIRCFTRNVLNLPFAFEWSRNWARQGERRANATGIIIVEETGVAKYNIYSGRVRFSWEVGRLDFCSSVKEVLFSYFFNFEVLDLRLKIHCPFESFSQIALFQMFVW